MQTPVKLQSPYYFQVGTRFGKILHARLRMQGSALNADLYRKNIVESPSLHFPYMLLQEDNSQPISTNTL